MTWRNKKRPIAWFNCDRRMSLTHDLVRGMTERFSAVIETHQIEAKFVSQIKFIILKSERFKNQRSSTTMRSGRTTKSAVDFYQNS